MRFFSLETGSESTATFITLRKEREGNYESIRNGLTNKVVIDGVALHKGAGPMQECTYSLCGRFDGPLHMAAKTHMAELNFVLCVFFVVHFFFLNSRYNLYP